MEITLGSIEELSNLYRASTIELIRRFSAKKLQEDRYLIPPEKIPWYTVIDLGSEYRLVGESGVLTVSGIELAVSNIPPHIDIPLGFLVKKSDGEYYCLGIFVTGRRKLSTCHARTYMTPFDLWEFPKNIQVPQITAVGVDVKFEPHMPLTVKVPLRCIQENFPELVQIVYTAITRCVIVLTDFVALVGKVRLRLSELNVRYVPEY